MSKFKILNSLIKLCSYSQVLATTTAIPRNPTKKIISFNILHQLYIITAHSPPLLKSFKSFVCFSQNIKIASLSL